MTRWKLPITAAMLPLAAFCLFTLAGCNGDADQQAGEVAAGDDDHGHSHAEGDAHDHDDHSGWWCAPHGVPEEECSQCRATAAAEFKENGDWCEEHNRAESQCFICNPENAEQFASLYREKYGEDPPALPE